MRIAFAFTGAGHLLRESVHVAEKLAENNEVTVLLSGAAEEVLKMYGLYERVERLTGGKYRELATDTNQKFSYPITGRLSLGKYDALIVTPATANTVSKIVYGIADTLVTNAVAQAGKGAVPVYMVPVDIHPGPIDTVLPSKMAPAFENIPPENFFLCSSRWLSSIRARPRRFLLPNIWSK